MKKIFLLLSFIILTGCSAEYSLDYSDNKFKEFFIVQAGENELCGDDLCSNYINSYYNTNISINYLDSEEELALSDDLNKYNFYQKNITTSNGSNQLHLFYDFNIATDYSSSYIANKLFKRFIVNDEVIQAYEINDIFLNYSYLDEIVIKFTTDKYIESTNCDEERDGVYYWYINKKNIKDKTINIKFNTKAINENIVIKDGYLTWNSIKYLFFVLILLLLIIIYIIYEKVKKSNK